jgi:hypothetical protein
MSTNDLGFAATATRLRDIIRLATLQIPDPTMPGDADADGS